MLAKHKYAGAIGTSCISIFDVETGDPKFAFTRQKLSVGRRYLVSGVTLDRDGDFKVHLREPEGRSYLLDPDTFDRCFVQA